VVDGVELAAYGIRPPERHGVPISAGGEPVGELVVGLRSGESRLAAADERVLGLLAAPIGVAVRASRLADEVGRSRERIIGTREEERRRLRRDLHDGLGPVLTGVVLNAETALRLLPSDPERASTLLAGLRDQTTAAISDIRRLVDDLGPPAALDALGLEGAVREQAAILSRRSDGSPLAVSVETSGDLGGLPAAVEVAAYRIVTEALTNVVRHSTARTAVVSLAAADSAVRVTVSDDGVNLEPGWKPGVGLASIRERTAELGGVCEIRHDRAGGVVSVTLPAVRSGRSAPAMRPEPAVRPEPAMRPEPALRPEPVEGHTDGATR
jgi:signal transduction histidine kinase